MSNESASPLPAAPSAPEPAHPAPPVGTAVHPLLPVVLPLVVAAIVLSIVFARLFPAGPGAAAPTVRFTNVAAAAGLAFEHRNGPADPPTTLAGAVVVLDYDGDGHPDLYFTNGEPWPWEETADNFARPTGALFRNDGAGGFADVTRAAGLAVPLQAMSAAAGDYDGDGDPDLFVTGVGGNRLFRNRGDGTFEDATAAAGVAGDDNAWSTGAAWVDAEGDGRLDLVVAHYARWPHEVGLPLAFSIANVGRSYGAPTGFVSAFPTVYRNRGDGTFEAVAGSAGLRDLDPESGLPAGKALAVVPVDANADGRLDLLFSYHTSPNALFLNLGDGTFRKWAGREARHEGAAAEIAAGAFAVASADGSAERLAAFLDPPRTGADGRDGRAGPHAALATRLGIAAFDFDLDGRIEVFSGEGRAEPDTNRFEDVRDFRAPPRLFWRGDAGWQAAGVVGPPVTARGVAVADFDGDGDLDVVVAQHRGAPLLLRNDQRFDLPWLRLRLVATRTHPEAGGARVEVHTPRRVLVQTVAPAMGFMAQSEGVLTFGLGEDARVRRIVVQWPSGRRQEIRPGAINRLLVIREE